MWLIFSVFVVFFFLDGENCEANLIKCIKKDECSCVTNTNPKLQMSLWQIKPDHDIMDFSTGSDWRFSIDLCHGVRMKPTSKKGCQNSTVCKYRIGSSLQPVEAYEIGHYGSTTFGDYDNSTKSIKIHAIALKENGTTRSIVIDMICKGKSSKDVYEYFKPVFNAPTNFTGQITSKAGCLFNYTEPLPTQRETNSGLRTIYIVLIVIGSIAVVILSIVIATCHKRKTNSLLDKEMHEDYGTNDGLETPSVYIENASSPRLS